MRLSCLNPGQHLDLKLPKTSIVYNGEQEGMWIRSSLASVSPWSGTLLDQLETKQEEIDIDVDGNSVDYAGSVRLEEA